MPKISINSTEHEFQEGLNLIDACRQAGIEIPHFCYHPALSVAGSCRMCQVEVEMGGRKSLTIACNTKVADGMSVFTETETAKAAQRGMMEFLLLNHPLDCPICDDAGECKLQNYYLLHHRQKSRMDEPRWHKHKVLDLGPHIVLDTERCILCSRCVRFYQEVVGREELGIFNSGACAELLPLPGKILDGDYSGNIVDLCPVGALTDKRFRFKRRVWYLKSQDSICPGCSRGCNIEIHYDLNHRWKSPQRRIQRIKPRYHPDVNCFWLCDAGRYGWEFVDAPDRLLKPLMRMNGTLTETHYEEAMQELCARLKSALSQGGAGKTAVLLAPQLSAGTLYLLKKILDELGINSVDYRLPSVKEGALDNLLQMNDRHPNSFAAKLAGLTPTDGSKPFVEILAGIENLIAIACDPAELLGEEREVLLKLKLFCIFHWTKVPALEWAHFAIPLATFAESDGVFLNFQGRAQRFHKAFESRGEAKAPYQVFLHLARQMGLKFPNLSEAELFNQFAPSESGYQGLTWERIGRQGYLPTK